METIEEKLPEGNMYITEIEKLRFIMRDATGLDIMYAYENLVFSEHGLYVFETDSKKLNEIHCYFNIDFEKSKQLLFLEKMILSASLNGMVLLNKGTFEMTQNPDGQSVSLMFHKL